MTKPPHDNNTADAAEVERLRDALSVAADKLAALHVLVRKYIETVGFAEGVDFIEEGPHLTKEDCAALFAICPRGI